MAWYRDGTVSVTLNSSTVTGASTRWVSGVRAGDGFLGPDARMYEVAGVVSDTSISITPAYKGATAAAQAYAITPIPGYVRTLADQAARLLNTVGVQLDEKVDKVEGKGLSQQDFTTTLRDKLNGIAAGATKIESVTIAATSLQDFFAKCLANGSGFYRAGGASIPIEFRDSSGFFSRNGDTWSFVINRYSTGKPQFYGGTYADITAGTWKLFDPNQSPAFTGTPSTPSLQFGNVASSNVNTLDYYEEGAFTPSISAATSAGSPTYANQTGRYTRIGNRVSFTLRMHLSSVGGMVGQLRITGLPFVMANSVAARGGVSFGPISGMSTIAPLIGNFLENQNWIVLSKIPTSGTASAALGPSDITDTFHIFISGQYEV